VVIVKVFDYDETAPRALIPFGDGDRLIRCRSFSRISFR
jgi:hypothetical protein